MTPASRDHEPAPRAADLPLAARLRAWRKHEDAAYDHDLLAARVEAAVRCDPAIVPPPPTPLRDRLRDRAAWFAAGLAAAVAIAWMVRPAGQTDPAADWPPSVRFAARQLAEKAELMAGMEATFGADLAWVAEHDQRVDVGLVPGHAGDSRPVAVRIVVLTRRSGETAWRLAWRTDVVARDEQVVDLATGPGGRGRLRLWTHPLPDGAIAVDGELSLVAANPPVAASYSGVQRPGEPRRVTGDHDNGVEWQVIQTVVPLDSAPGVREGVG